MRFTLVVAGLVAILGGSALARTVASVVDQTTSFLIRDWVTDQRFDGFQPPQVFAIEQGTKVYGGCGEFVRGDEVGGSSYCPATNTIYLVPSQLNYFYKAFGPSSVAYVVAHEFGHAIQNRYGSLEGGAEVELQADCLAGILVDYGSTQLGITRQDTIQMAQAAYAIGDPTHGTGAQRTYALLSGMGVVDAGCSKQEMLSLLNNQVSDPAYMELRATRSGAGNIDINKSPHPKTLGEITNGL